MELSVARRHRTSSTAMTHSPPASAHLIELPSLIFCQRLGSGRCSNSFRNSSYGIFPFFSPYTNRDSVNSAGLTDGSRRATEVWFHGNFPFLKQPLRYVAAVSVALTPATKLS